MSPYDWNQSSTPGSSFACNYRKCSVKQQTLISWVLKKTCSSIRYKVQSYKRLQFLSHIFSLQIGSRFPTTDLKANHSGISWQGFILLLVQKPTEKNYRSVQNPFENGDIFRIVAGKGAGFQKHQQYIELRLLVFFVWGDWGRVRCVDTRT